MFGEKKSVRLSNKVCKKIASAFLICGFAAFSQTLNVKAADGKSKPSLKSTSKQRFTADVRLDNFAAEVFSGATKISWKTGFEQNIVGFKIWREDNGQKILVNEDFVAGSLLQVGDGILPAGNEYDFYDLTDSTNVYYNLEAVDINGKSHWFGPVYPQINFEQTEISKESETIARLNENKNDRRQQIETVDFLTPVLKKAVTQKLSPTNDSLLANDPNAVKMEIRNRGIYRIEAQTLTDAGFNGAESANWKLFVGGIEQPITINSDGSVEFFGQGIDTLQTDANIYWLITDTNAGKRTNHAAKTYVNSAKNSWTRITAERRDRSIRVSSVINGARENWFGAIVTNTASNQALELSNIGFDSGQTATVGVDLQGLTAVSHQVSVLLNGISIGQINFSAFDRTEWTANVALTNLVEGTNTLTLQSLGGSTDVNISESVRVSYPRSLKAQNNRLEFSVNAGQAVRLRGFTNQQVHIFDVTNPAQSADYLPASRLETDGTYTVTLASASSARLMLAQTENLPLYAAPPFIRNNPSDLKNVQNQAKFVVIAPFEFKNTLQSFCDLRTSRGIQTKFVDVQDIYDEFNNGVKSAEAIRAFLQFAKQNWTVKPDFAMFVGDASVDPRNYTGFGGDNNNRVPTLLVDTWNMETVSDEALADFNDDGVGEIAVGRLPAKDETELQTMLDKITAAVPMSRGQVNQRGVHFVSDGFGDYNFPAGSRNMATFFPATVTVNYLDSGGLDAATVRGDIINRINSGAAVINYFGHASIGTWSGAQIFRNVDAASLTNSPNSPFIAMIDCLNGDYAETNITGIAEAMMKQRGGGANAVWAASGWNLADDQEFFARDFYQKVFSGMPLGEAARRTKMLYPNIDLRRTYIFFGDPTQSLVTP